MVSTKKFRIVTACHIRQHSGVVVVHPAKNSNFYFLEQIPVQTHFFSVNHKLKQIPNSWSYHHNKISAKQSIPTRDWILLRSVINSDIFIWAGKNHTQASSHVVILVSCKIYVHYFVVAIILPRGFQSFRIIQFSAWNLNPIKCYSKGSFFILRCSIFDTRNFRGLKLMARWYNGQGSPISYTQRALYLSAEVTLSTSFLLLNSTLFRWPTKDEMWANKKFDLQPTVIL